MFKPFQITRTSAEESKSEYIFNAVFQFPLQSDWFTVHVIIQRWSDCRKERSKNKFGIYLGIKTSGRFHLYEVIFKGALADQPFHRIANNMFSVRRETTFHSIVGMSPNT